MTLRLFRHFNSILPPNHIWIIGNFDGLHKGHQVLIDTAREIAAETGQKIGILSFNPHPNVFFSPHKNAIHIMQQSEKIRLLAQWGIDYYYLHPFNAQLAQMSATAFCYKLKSQFQPTHLIIGHDFHFGKNRSGTPEFLNEFCTHNAINCIIVPPVLANNQMRYASGAIRDFLQQGDIKSVNHFLGHPYIITGRVRHGRKLASQLGFPTANIIPKNLFLPKYGVYKCHITNMNNMPAIANIGVKPTIDNNDIPLVEVHIPNFTGNLYGKKLRIAFDDFMRAEQKFGSLEALKKQIHLDVKR
ncbi:MAG: riboflavin kinase/FMN adenylyltransferase [Alphaproteobacteria bacterium]|jgi:riboflavin kinase/FMN adenylyltransferase